MDTVLQPFSAHIKSKRGFFFLGGYPGSKTILDYLPKGDLHHLEQHCLQQRKMLSSSYQVVSEDENNKEKHP